MTPSRLLCVLFAVLVLAGCQSAGPSPMDQPLIARFYVEAAPGTPAVPVQLPVSRTVVNLAPKPVLTEYDIANVEFTKVRSTWCLYFQFTSAAGRDLYRLSAASLGRRLVLMLNDRAVGFLVMDQALSQGGLLIILELPDEDLPPIAERLKRTSAELARRSH